MEDTLVEEEKVEVIEPLYSVELDDDELEAVKNTVVESNKGKAEDELATEIEAANTAALDAKKLEAAPVLAEMEKLAKLEENKDKSETEILELASAAIAASAEEDDEGEEGVGDDFYGNRAPAVPAKGEAPIAADLSEEVKQKVAKYDAIENDVVYKAYLAAKENNADIDFVDLIIQSGLTNNPANVTDPAYFKELELNELRQSDASITDEDVKDFLEEFREKSKIAQWSEVKGTKDSVMNQYQNAKAVLATKASSGVESSKESSQQIVTEAESELKSYGDVFRSVKMTKEQTSKVLNTIRSGSVVVMSNGKVDVARTVEVALKDTLERDIVNAAYLRGKRDAERKSTIRSSKPMRGIKMRGSTPKSVSTDSRAEFNKNREKAWAAKNT